MPFLLVYVTHPSKPEALRITAELLNSHLIACANFFPIESMYWWDGRLSSTEEIVTIYKTRLENWKSLKTAIESSHKYDVPCIIKMQEVEANQSYENWIQAETIPRQ
jgi:periplasmic divalent cation tolerance protein